MDKGKTYIIHTKDDGLYFGTFHQYTVKDGRSAIVLKDGIQKMPNRTAEYSKIYIDRRQIHKKFESKNIGYEEFLKSEKIRMKEEIGEVDNS